MAAVRHTHQRCGMGNEKVVATHSGMWDDVCMTNEQREAIVAMSDKQLVRFARILRLTKAVHEFNDEDAFVAAELTRRLDASLLKKVEQNG